MKHPQRNPGPSGAPRRSAPEVCPNASSLVRRKYLNTVRPGAADEFSARIEVDGQHAFFPLATDRIKVATQQADTLRELVARSGWAAAGARFVREFTLAVFWLPNPLTCTYASLFTVLRPPKASPKNTAPAVRVALLEPDAPVRWGLVQWLNRIPGHTCVTAHPDADSLLQAIPGATPDFVLFDGPPCTPATEHLRAKLAGRFPDLATFPFGIYRDSEHAWYCVTGVDGGYYYRRRRPEEMLEPIAGLWPGQRPGRDAVESQIRNHVRTLFGLRAAAVEAFPGLTVRERDVLAGLRRGYTDKTIAAQLRISAWTVHTHMKRLFEKLGVHTRTEAVAKLFEK